MGICMTYISLTSEHIRYNTGGLISMYWILFSTFEDPRKQIISALLPWPCFIHHCICLIDRYSKSLSPVLGRQQHIRPFKKAKLYSV